MISDVVAPMLLGLLEDNRELVTDFVVRRKRFEPWLQEALFERLCTEKSNRRAERERYYPDSQERCDIWLSEAGQEYWLELKCCTTNYLHRFTESSITQNITNEIDEIIRDGNKLRCLPETVIRRIMFLAYPLPTEYATHVEWSAHIKRIRESKVKIMGSREVKMERKGTTAMVVIYECEI